MLRGRHKKPGAKAGFGCLVLSGSGVLNNSYATYIVGRLWTRTPLRPMIRISPCIGVGNEVFGLTKNVIDALPTKILIEVGGTVEHVTQVRHNTDIPTADIFVKCSLCSECLYHICHITRTPLADVAIFGNGGSFIRES